LVDAIPDGLRIIDQNYNQILVNQAYKKQVNDNDPLKQKCYQSSQNINEPCPSALVTCPLKEINHTANPLKIIHYHKSKNASPLNVEIIAAPMKVTRNGKETSYIVESIRDLSDDVSFTHEQNLSGIGQLAAGVAHEIYNPLSTVSMAILPLMEILKKSSVEQDAFDYLNAVEHAIEQCVCITDKLLRLSASPSEKLELVDVQQAVKDVYSLVKWDAKHLSVSLRSLLPTNTLWIYASEGEFRMLILNIIQNAFNAMPKGGELLIKATTVVDDIVIKFEDSGVGIAKADLQNVFTPFFSRRANGTQGTGLGLAIARQLVLNFDGTLEVESVQGRGSCFTLIIPCACIAKEAI